MRVIAVALELEHAVDQVLEHARACDCAVLGHVADEDGGDVLLLRDPEQAAGGLADLADRAGRRAHVGGIESLDRVDHADVGPLALEGGADGIELGLGEDLDVLGAAEPRRAQLHLRGRLLAGDEERTAAAGGDRTEGAEEQGRLADAGLAADEDEAGRDEPAAEDAVELGHAGRDPLRLLGVDVDEAEERLRRGSPSSMRQGVSSTSEPKALQPGHLPNQRPAE